MIYRKLYDLIEYLQNEGDFKNNIRIINEIIKIMELYLLYEDKESKKIHDLFCEYNFLEKINIFSKKKIKEINSQILKTLSTLMSKVMNIFTFYYLMSNNFINNIITINNCFIKNDHSFVALYVNFIQIVSSKLNKTTLQFLFIQEIDSFPLLENAIKLYNYPDKNIKNSIKKIFLDIIKIDYKPLYDYLSELPIISYFCFLSCNIKDNLILLSQEIKENKSCKQNKSQKNKISNITKIINDIIDDLIYIQNIFDANCDKINYIIINCMFYYNIIPYILKFLNFKNIRNNNKRLDNHNKVKKSVCIFFIDLLFTYINNGTFLNMLFTLLFFPFKSNSINKYMLNFPIQPDNYYYNWEESLKKTSSSFLNYIQYNFNNHFLKTFLYKNNSKFTQVQQIYEKYQKKINNDPSFNVDDENQKLLKEIIKDILSKLSFSEINIMSSYHNYLSIGTGMNCGLSTKYSDGCIIKKMEKFYIKYFNIENRDLFENKFAKNFIKDNLFSYLKIKNQNKSDKKILFINIMLRNILSRNQNNNISRLLLKESNIIPGNMLKDEEISYIINLNKEKSLTNNRKIYRNNMVNTYNNNEDFIIEDENSFINKKESKEKNIYKNNNYINENKENNDNNIQYYETDICKLSKVSKTLISLNDIVKISRNTIPEKQIIKLANIDNNGNEKEKDKKLLVDKNKYRNDEFQIQDQTIIINLPKNKYSPFKNEYFYNFESNILNNSNDSLCWENNNITYYNEELVDILIKLLDINSNMKVLTSKIIIDNILYLITSIKENYIYDKNNLIIHCIISENDKNKIYFIFEKYKNEIINNYNNKKNFHNNAYKLLVKQYEKYILLNKENDYIHFIKDGYILTNNTSNTYLDFDSNMNKYDKNILLFFLMHDLYYKIILYENYSNKNESILYLNNFPLINKKSLKLNTRYYLIDLDTNIKYYNCQCKIIESNNNIDIKQKEDNFFYCYILLYDNFLYIGDSSINSSYTFIKYKFLISDCEIEIDNYNNKNILINVVDENTNLNNNIQILLDFKDYNTSKNIKSLIEQEKKNSIFYEKSKIKEFLENLK